MAKWDAHRKLGRNKALAEYAANHPELSYREIGEAFDLSSSAAHYIIKRYTELNGKPDNKVQS